MISWSYSKDMFFFGKGLQHMAEFQTFELMIIMCFAFFGKQLVTPHAIISKFKFERFSSIHFSGLVSFHFLMNKHIQVGWFVLFLCVCLFFSASIFHISQKLNQGFVSNHHAHTRPSWMAYAPFSSLQISATCRSLLGPNTGRDVKRMRFFRVLPPALWVGFYGGSFSRTYAPNGTVRLDFLSWT